jgi:type II secretory pathway pseudopilin PulG
MRNAIRWRSARGFTLAEATVVLATLSVLGAAVAPAMNDYLAEARVVRARQDVHTIASALLRFTGDVGGQATKPGAWATFEVLAGAGTVPSVGKGDRAWLASGPAQVGSLADQMVLNTPGYTMLPASQMTSPRGWHGPYLEAGVSADPWGHRYAVNVRALDAGQHASVIVLSAGPDGLVDTPFLSLAGVPGGDDLAALVFGAR